MTISEKLQALKLKVNGDQTATKQDLSPTAGNAPPSPAHAAQNLAPVGTVASQTSVPAVAEKRTFVYKTGADGQELLTDVHWAVAPSKSTFDLSAPRPTAIVLHAGGFVVGDKDFIPRATVPHLVSLGFIVVVPNFRLCPQISVYDGPLQDSRDTLFWTRGALNGLFLNTVPKEQRVSVDSSRIVTVGYSAGGTLALLLGTGYRPVAAVLDIYGGKDFADPSWSLPNKGFLTRPTPPDEFASKIFDGPQPSAFPIQFGRPPVPSPRGAWMTLTSQRGTWLREVIKDGDVDRVDPIVQARNAPKGSFPPVFTLHGDADQFVPVDVSRNAAEKLRAAGVVVTYLSVPGADHLFDMGLGEEEELFRTSVGRGFAWLAQQVASGGNH
ncbi:hypothetical protein HKX48_001157 [Thoreauomyces humboldtii]|nr:hypothetical protein HKX48_001157 [Thoreauomyces humboldtii]